MYYGKIDFIYNNKGKCEVGETMYFEDKKSFEKEIEDSVEIGRPIKTIIFTDNELNLER